MSNATAIIVAGGAGRRMGSNLPKQYFKLDGLPILIHTLKKFEEAPMVGEIILVVPASDVEFIKREIADKFSIKKMIHVTYGGEKRQDSVRNGLQMVQSNSDITVIHDGVRPFISQTLIDRAIKGAIECGAVAVAVPVKDTVKAVDSQWFVKETLKRKELWLVQTPQVFQTSLIKQAYRKAYDEQYYATDDASLVERIGGSVKIITGSYNNIKITTPEDIIIGEYILKEMKRSI